MDDESVRSDLVDDLMVEPDPDAPAARPRQWVERVRKVWRRAITWPLWPVTVLVAALVVGALIYVAVGLIAGLFNGIVD
ncbi:hypothetical protein GCM10029964_011360 [Kibdelosporangium lantanae]